MMYKKASAIKEANIYCTLHGSISPYQNVIIMFTLAEAILGTRYLNSENEDDVY
jgi:hypothetical protein